MGSVQTKFNRTFETNDPSDLEEGNGEIISIDECKKYLEKFHLSDQRILKIKDNLIGIVDSIFNSYLEEFK